jgi:nicotinamide-nucleotide amidase
MSERPPASPPPEPQPPSRAEPPVAPASDPSPPEPAPTPTLRGAVLSVGSELLLGDLTDTNATWLSHRLTEFGVEVVHHLAVRDDLGEFVAAVRWLAQRAELVVVGGGLGPTTDDLTREALAAAAEVDLRHHDDLEAQIRERFAAMRRPMPAVNLRQARIPAGATPIPPVGTAPGFLLTLRGDGHETLVVALPGVPWELRQLFEEHVVPEVQARTGGRATVTRVVHVVGRGESDVAERVEPLLVDHPEVTLAFLARSQEIEVRLTVQGPDPDAARAASQPVVDAVVAALGTGVAGVDDESLEATVLRLLDQSATTMATAESATAGDICARLGRIPGAAAHGLIGGCAVYATEAKLRFLDVPGTVVEQHGPVSAEVTQALAAAVRVHAEADWGLAVTGAAGPEPAGDVAVGTCFWGLAHPDGHVEVHGRRIPGDREQVIARLGSVALDLLRRRLLER